MIDTLLYQNYFLKNLIFYNIVREYFAFVCSEKKKKEMGDHQLSTGHTLASEFIRNVIISLLISNVTTITNSE